MPPLDNTIQTKWIRLPKQDGHLGALYDPLRGIIRFIGGGGTVDYDLVALAEDERRKREQTVNRNGR